MDAFQNPRMNTDCAALRYYCLYQNYEILLPMVVLLLFFIQLKGETKNEIPYRFGRLAALGLLVSCAHKDPHPMDMTRPQQAAKTSADHIALATHYEQTAKSLQAQADAEKRELAEYVYTCGLLWAAN